jgi:L-amino acid N-acyltransferase YncA
MPVSATPSPRLSGLGSQLLVALVAQCQSLGYKLFDRWLDTVLRQRAL